MTIKDILKNSFSDLKYTILRFPPGYIIGNTSYYCNDLWQFPRGDYLQIHSFTSCFYCGNISLYFYIPAK